MNGLGRLVSAAALMLAYALSGRASAHHSFAGFYDRERIIEIEGVLTEISWRNPHGRLRVDVTDEAGRSVEWTIETGTISIFRIRGIDPNFAKVGDRVRLAGQASVRSPTAMYAQQMLLPDGHEVLLSIGIEPRWTNAATGELLEPVFDESVAAEARQAADGIFRVWSTVLEDPAAFPMFKGGYPLTERGKELHAQWDPASVALNDCSKKAMPLLMISPFPIEFARDGENILIRFEEDDAVRRIHMGASTPPSEHTLLGYSTGQWENGSLVVTTSHLVAELFDPDGVRQSADIRLVERFMPAADGSRMDYRITVTDPEIFTESFDLTRYFVWRPELQVHAYDCKAQP